MIRKTAFALMLASTAGLAGCVGGNTYGTGVSQEAQLLNDLTGIVPLGTPDRKPKIDYSARPKLVRAPASEGTLPSPAEPAGGAESAYFPTNPEDRLAAARAGKKRGFVTNDGGVEYTIPEDVDAPSASGEPINDLTRGRHDEGTGDHEPTAAEMAVRSTQGSKERLKRMREISGSAALGTGPRQYLTQPPQEYRQPAGTAPVGELGEYEYGEKEKKSIFSSIFGTGNKKTVVPRPPAKSSPVGEKRS